MTKLNSMKLSIQNYEYLWGQNYQKEFVFFIDYFVTKAKKNFVRFPIDKSVHSLLDL